MRAIIIFYFVLSIVVTDSQSALIRHTFVIEYFSGSTDGVYKEKILGINGQFPGPTIEGHVGDTLQVDVINRIQDRQNTSIHWHGIHQKGSQWNDGAARITQCPIAYSQSQRYSFELKQAGTFWYHSHVHSQYTEGLWGVLLVHRTPEAYSYDGRIIITLSDWYHHTAHENERFQLTPEMGSFPYPDSGLINGVGRYNCGFALHACNVSHQMRPVFHLPKNKTYRVHVINAAALVAFNFSIDGHPLQVIESDSRDVKDGLIYDFVSITSGQRYSFLIKTNVENDDGRFHIRAQIRTEILLLQFVSITNNNRYTEVTIANISAILHYSDSESDSVEYEPFSYLDEIPLLEKEVTHLDEMELGPLDGYAPRQFDVETILSTEFLLWTDNIRRGTFNSTPFIMQDITKPLLMSVVDGEAISNDFMHIEVELWKIVQVIINNPHNGPHPLHLHGHDFWVLGKGKWNDGIFVEERDRKTLVLTGPKRDTVMVEEKSWIVIRFIADNPGVWLFHCHIDWHMLTGMSAVFVVGREELEMLNVDEEARHVCRHNMYSIDNKSNDITRDTDTTDTPIMTSPIIDSGSVSVHMNFILLPCFIISLLQVLQPPAIK